MKETTNNSTDGNFKNPRKLGVSRKRSFTSFDWKYCSSLEIKQTLDYDYISTMVLSCLITLTVLLISPLKHLEAVELKEVKLGETVALMCNLSFYSDIHWLKISEGRPMDLMVASLKHTGELSVVWSYDETHFEGFMEKQMTGLRILHVSTSDLATYYCATSYQKRLNFDKGVQLYTNLQSKNKPFDEVQGPTGLSLHYQVFVAVLCFGLLGMLVSVLVVHMKTRKKTPHPAVKNKRGSGIQHTNI